MPGPNQDADLYGIPRGEVTPPQHLLDEYNRLRGEVSKLKTVEMLEDILAVHAGLNVTTEHGRDTPSRFLNMLDELTACKNCNGDCVKWRKFDAETDEMIIVKKIPFISVCNHHIIPFVGEARIGYVPCKLEAGLSKFGRVVQHYARQLQTQERLTSQITDFLQMSLSPLGVIVQLEAEHMCMTVRGVQMPGATTVTTKTLGVFADHTRTAKVEFLESIK
jgi:GTP cyclohydrolase I